MYIRQLVESIFANKTGTRFTVHLQPGF